MDGAPAVTASKHRLDPQEDDVTAVMKEELNPRICHPECSFLASRLFVSVSH